MNLKAEWHATSGILSLDRLSILFSLWRVRVSQNLTRPESNESSLGLRPERHFLLKSKRLMGSVPKSNLLLQRRRPVHDECDGRGLGVVGGQDREPLAIGAYVVMGTGEVGQV